MREQLNLQLENKVYTKPQQMKGSVLQKMLPIFV